MKMKRIKICNYVQQELQELREKCNFTDEELAYFNLKAKDKSNIQISFEMHVSESKVERLSRQVKNKIFKVKGE